MKPYYQDDWATIYHGDAREVLCEISMADLVLTDPPYGRTENEWDSFEWSAEWWEHMRRIGPNAIVMTAQQPFTSIMVAKNLEWFKWADVWHKTQATGHLNAKLMPLREHEDVLVFGPGRVTFNPQLFAKPLRNRRPAHKYNQSANYGKFDVKARRTIEDDISYPRSVIRFPNEQRAQHPTQKPLEMFKYLVATYANPGQLVLDTFAGSGTTLRAAKDSGMMSIGIEISEKYCEIAANRLRQGVLAFSDDRPISMAG